MCRNCGKEYKETEAICINQNGRKIFIKVCKKCKEIVKNECKKSRCIYCNRESKKKVEIEILKGETNGPVEMNRWVCEECIKEIKRVYEIPSNNEIEWEQIVENEIEETENIMYV
tara:strand:+ start:154 stop:498 length:345 start_codon:yes stop_codon:yes gene_type:complete